MGAKKIILLVPGKNARGGITNYYYSLKNKFSLDVEYFVRGAREYPARKGILSEGKRFFSDLKNFTRLLKEKDVAAVQLSTNLDKYSPGRDSLYLLAAKIYGKKVITFFHGWDKTVEESIEKKYLPLFRYIFFKSDCVIVLSKQFAGTLKRWGYKKKVYTETTVVDDYLLQGINKAVLEQKWGDKNPATLLFLSRVEKRKGVYELIDGFAILKNKYRHLKLVIAGDGLELERLKNYVLDHNIKDVAFTGFVEGRTKKKVLFSSGIFVFPSYSEGMPTSVLEAMACGLPVVTTKVGGLTDFFESGKHGYFIEDLSPGGVVFRVEQLLNNKNILKEMSLNNFEYAAENFAASVVIKRIEGIFMECICAV